MRHASQVRRMLTATLLAGAAAITPPALAQQGSADAVAAPDSATEEAAAYGAPGDIIVTAQKREERLRDVPIAVSAITSADIANRNVTTLDQLQATVPGLRLVDIGPGSQRIQLRGISQYQGLPTVGNYLDEFSVNPIAASGPVEIRLLDMERVEVLRGPQPTLYGEGSMGGTIRYVTANPDLTRVSGNVLGEVSDVRGGEVGYRAEGVINLPIAKDAVGLRLAAAHEKYPGWIDGPLGKNANDSHVTAVRGKFFAKAGDALSVTLLGQYQESNQDVKSYSNANRVTAQIVPSIAKQRYAIGTALIAYDAGPVTILSSTGYLHQKGRSVDDSAKFYNGLFGAPLLRTAITDARGTTEKWSQELRLTSNSSGPLRYLLAGSYTDTTAKGTILGDGESLVPGLPASALGVVFNQVSRQESKVWALYGNLAYDIGPLTLEAGGRYFSDKRSIDSTFDLTGFPPPSVSQGSATFHTFNPRAAVTLHTGDSGIVYVSAAKGFRSGGFNQVTAPVIPPTFGPERLWTYEAGAKQSLIGSTLFVEAAVYYNDYRNIQANQLVNPTVATVLNAGKAGGPGVDLSLQARPARALSFTASLGYNHLRYKQTTTDRKKGDPADLVPDWNWSVAIDANPRLSEGARLIAHADLNYTAKGYIILRSPPLFDQAIPNQDRAVANVRLGVDLERYQIYAFATNLLDENRIINPAFGAFFEPTYTRPRTIGAGFRANF